MIGDEGGSAEELPVEVDIVSLSFDSISFLLKLLPEALKFVELNFACVRTVSFVD